ncbi:ATP-binding protein [Brevundimonas sp.]|uniref:sensor histidine kinase n=1 Tax=Brevundimonas sp. TaxID=1871086 RepID=UPI0025C12A30|nr:ATP-binding protein [Brevundimonas sp.]
MPDSSGTEVPAEGGADPITGLDLHDVTGKRSASEILFSMATTRSYRGWRAYLLAIGAVLACFALRAVLELFGHFYYLPLVPAVVITAMLARRAPTALAIALSIAGNVMLVSRESLADTLVNAGLFVVVGWLVAEICWAQRRMHRRSMELTRTLAGRNAVLDTVLATVPVVILGREGQIRRLTPAAASLFGIDSFETADRSFGELVHGFDLQRLDGKASNGPLEAPTGHWIGRRPDGRPLILSLQMGVMPMASEEDYAAVCITDLTEAEMATERARDLDIQLNRVWRLNSLGEMAATLAHELNQPLSAATTYMQASQRDIERAGLIGQSAARTLDLAKGQVLRAGSIIRRMRDMLVTGTRRLESERISSMIEDLGPAFALIARDRGVEIRTDVDDSDDIVRAERIQFQQAVINLVRNAAEAVADQAQSVVVIRGQSLDGGGYRLTVEDSGPGIPGDDIEAVFRPMTTTKSSGMGLGLSVTRTIVESHGGALSVGRSDLGGAAFSIELPQETEEA